MFFNIFFQCQYRNPITNPIKLHSFARLFFEYSNRGTINFGILHEILDGVILSLHPFPCLVVRLPVQPLGENNAGAGERDHVLHKLLPRHVILRVEVALTRRIEPDL